MDVVCFCYDPKCKLNEKWGIVLEIYINTTTREELASRLLFNLSLDRWEPARSTPHFLSLVHFWDNNNYCNKLLNFLTIELKTASLAQKWIRFQTHLRKMPPKSQTKTDLFCTFFTPILVSSITECKIKN